MTYKKSITALLIYVWSACSSQVKRQVGCVFFPLSFLPSYSNLIYKGILFPHTQLRFLI